MGGSNGGGIPPLNLMPLENGKTLLCENLKNDRYLGLVFNRDNYSKGTRYSVPDEIWSWDSSAADPKEAEDGHQLYILAKSRYLQRATKSTMVERIEECSNLIGDIDRYGILSGGSDDVRFTRNGYVMQKPDHGKAANVALERGFWWKNGREVFRNDGFEEALYIMRHCYPLEEMTVRVGSDHSRRWQWLHILESHVLEGRVNYFLMAKAWIDLEILRHLGENVDALTERLKEIIEEPICNYVSLSDLRDMDPVDRGDEEIAEEELH